MYYVYIIQSSKSGRFYIGYCSNVDARLKRHNNHHVKSTRGKGPYKLIYTEEFVLKQDALKREKQIKSYKGGRSFKKLIASSPSSSLAQDIRFSF